MAIDTSVEQQATLLYEKEVQIYLSENLHLLGDSRLELIQAEYPIKFGTDSGRVDLLAKDNSGNLVVIEVKRGVAGRSAVGQIQSYMGSLIGEFPGKKIRGLLVAMGLDEAARSALLVTQNIGYCEFKTRFDFMRIEITMPDGKSLQSVTDAEVRSNYWEGLGGRVTDKAINCQHCDRFSRVVVVGESHLCGVCGKSAI